MSEEGKERFAKAIREGLIHLPSADPGIEVGGTYHVKQVKVDTSFPEIGENDPRHQQLDRLFMNEVTLSVVLYCAEEVDRQGDSPKNVAGMVTAWDLAMRYFDMDRPLDIGLIEQFGKLVAPKKNAMGFRDGEGFIVNTATNEIVKRNPAPALIRSLMQDLIDGIGDMEPVDAYFRFEDIHPFSDGNGRVGKIILNWLNGSLGDPVMPPNKFGIRNP
jgi:hypothetical protein